MTTTSEVPTASPRVEPYDLIPVAILYRNHRGKVALRRILPSRWRFDEQLPWHPGHQWLVDAWDADKGAERTFALANILEWFTTTIDTAPKDPFASVRCLSCGSLDHRAAACPLG